MEQINFSREELEELTAAVREGAVAIVKAWTVLTKIGSRRKRDWEPEGGHAVRDIMDLFASRMTNPEQITSAAVKEAFSRPADWLQRADS